MAAEDLNNPVLNITLDGVAATEFLTEADMDNLSPAQLIRTAIGTYRIMRSVLREISAYFPEDTELSHRLTIIAAGPEHIKEFRWTPKSDSQQVVLTNEYNA